MNTQDEINRLDLAYSKLTGRAFKASGVITGREWLWSQFIKAGYTVHELEEVVLWIKRGILAGKRFEGALKFQSLLQLDKFEDELLTCRAERRNLKPAPTPKERVLSQCRPVAVEIARSENTARPISDWIAELRRSVASTTT